MFFTLSSVLKVKWPWKSLNSKFLFNPESWILFQVCVVSFKVSLLHIISYLYYIYLYYVHLEESCCIFFNILVPFPFITICTERRFTIWQGRGKFAAVRTYMLMLQRNNTNLVSLTGSIRKTSENYSSGYWW